MSDVLVTGATGLIGSNLCQELLDRGYGVRALVRSDSRADELRDLGVVVVSGDVAVYDDVRRAARGCEYCIHAAALVVGGPEHTLAEYHDVNVAGSFNVFDAAKELGLARVVSYASVPDPRATDYPLGAFGDDPYLTAKLQVAKEVMRRAAAGQDIVEISPGAAYGPAPTGARAVAAPGFNSRLVLALRGELLAMPAFVLSFNLASDVAISSVRALTRGEPGERFDLGGPLDERVDTVSFLNFACERAGVGWRVRAMSVDELDSDDVAVRFGPSIMMVARRYLADPTAAAAPSAARLRACEVLGHDPTPSAAGVGATTEWMLSLGLV